VFVDGERVDKKEEPRPFLAGSVRSIIIGYYTLENTEQALQATRQDLATIKSVVVPKEG
jgi:hypothetical protein